MFWASLLVRLLITENFRFMRLLLTELQALKNGPKLKNHPEAEIGQNFKGHISNPFWSKKLKFQVFYFSMILTNGENFFKF